jgi:hypothetical protein
MTGRIWWTLALVAGLALPWLSAPSPAQQKEKVYRRITTEQVEKILNALDIDYVKTKDRKFPGTYYYDYGTKYKIALGFHNGTHLWMTANFPKATLETINKWNTNAKFSRAVLVMDKDNIGSTVESQLDCSGGVTEAMLRQFVVRFDGEVQSFAQFLQKK